MRSPTLMKMATVATLPEIVVLSEKDKKGSIELVRSPMVPVKSTALNSQGTGIQHQERQILCDTSDHNISEVDIVAEDACSLFFGQSKSQECHDPCRDEQIKEVPHSLFRCEDVIVDTSRILDWFRCTFSQVVKHGHISLKDFKHIAKSCDKFVENLFNLFDTDRSGSISLQELIGGMGRLLHKNKQKKVLKYVEDLFVLMSGEDQLLQLEEFEVVLHSDNFLEYFYNLMVNSNEELSLEVMLSAFSNIACMDSDGKWSAWFEQKFCCFGGDDHEINFDEFKRILRIKESFFAERFFHIFDKDKNNRISLVELKDGLSQLMTGTVVDKLQILFQVYDIDGNGQIDYYELRTVLHSCMGESALQFSDDQLDELTRALIEDADATNSGSLTFEELQTALGKHPGLIENLSFSAANWFQPRQSSRQRRRIKRLPHWMRLHYFRNNLTWIIWLFLYFAVNTILFVEAAIKYRNRGFAVAVARGCGQCLNYNSMFVVVLMFRRVLTWLRSTTFSFLFPLDQSIAFHKLIGYTIFIFSSIHTTAHTVSFIFASMNPGGLPLWQYFIYNKKELKWFYGTAGLTGDFLIIILIIMVLFSMHCIRRKGYFEVFYWTHNLFIPWYILLILHGPNFWKWFLLPALIYIIERIARSKWVELARYGRFFIKTCSTLPSKVTHLSLTRPERFKYQPGDYIFLRIPAIAKFEWHPFTISSSPEQQDFIGLHIRSVGTWTTKLYDFVKEKNRSNVQPAFKKFQVNLSQRSGTSYIKMIEGSGKLDTATDSYSSLSNKLLEVFIDGPYGTPSLHVFQAEHAVLIGAGIGVTPFASILQSIASKYRNTRQMCPQCHHHWTGEIPSTVMRLKKVDFFWISRDQRSFEWFVSLLTNLEIEESDRVQNGFERFLDFHLYMTSALRKTDMKAIGLQMALDLIHKKENRDLITGLKTRTQTGRPDWNKVFQHLANNKKGKVSVFFCGPPAISKVLKPKCTKFKFEFRKEHF